MSSVGWKVLRAAVLGKSIEENQSRHQECGRFQMYNKTNKSTWVPRIYFYLPNNEDELLNELNQRQENSMVGCSETKSDEPVEEIVCISKTKKALEHFETVLRNDSSAYNVKVPITNHSDSFTAIYEPSHCEAKPRVYNRLVYEIPCSKSSAYSLISKERSPNAPLSLQDLQSHLRHDGVDNTGNIRVWPSEQVLLHYCLNQIPATHWAGKRICELGAGMTGIAGLGLAVVYGKALKSVVLTDGNAQSVEHLNDCIGENRHQAVTNNTSRSNIDQLLQLRASVLRWNKSDSPAKLQQLVGKSFDTILAADCLFFEDFHQDLAHVIHSLLNPEGGIAYLLQPRRNGSMQRFIDIATEALHIKVFDTGYDALVDQMHQDLLSQSSAAADYEPDVHFPVLLKITHRESQSNKASNQDEES